VSEEKGRTGGIRLFFIVPEGVVNSPECSKVCFCEYSFKLGNREIKEGISKRERESELGYDRKSSLE
jgi:hypothetical protein